MIATGSAVAGVTIGGAVGGATASLITGGNVLVGALTGGAFGYVGYYADHELIDRFTATMAHGMVGGISNVLQSRQFGSGFLSAFAGKGIVVSTSGFMNGEIGAGVKATIAGGVASELGGGKFKDGAVTAAMGYLFNDALQEESHYEQITAKVEITNFVEAKITHNFTDDNNLDVEFAASLKAGGVKVTMDDEYQGKISFGGHNFGFKGKELKSYGVSYGAFSLTLSDAGHGMINMSGSVSIKKLGAITVGWKLDLAGRVGNWGNANAVRDRYNQQRSDICREMQEYCTPPSTPSW